MQSSTESVMNRMWKALSDTTALSSSVVFRGGLCIGLAAVPAFCRRRVVTHLDGLRQYAPQRVDLHLVVIPAARHVHENGEERRGEPEHVVDRMALGDQVHEEQRDQ